MPRPLSIAMAISVAIHLALFLIADWLLRGEARPATITAALLVSITPPRAEGDIADDKLVVPASASETSSQGTGGRANRASARVAEPDEVTERVVADGRLADDLIEPAASDPVPLDAGREPVVDAGIAPIVEQATASPADVVATIPTDEPVFVTRAALLPKQEKMLNRKLREWSENLHRMPDTASGMTWEHRGQEYLATFTEVPADGETGIQRVVVEISTEEDGKRLSTEVHLKRLAFSNYGQFVNRWDPDVQIHDDEMEGRFHSNTEISLTYDRKVKPLFHGMVTTTSRSVNVTNTHGFTKRSQIFAGGLQTGVRSIRLPKHFVPFPDESGVSDDRIHRFAEDARIVFQADGSYAWQAIDSESPRQVWFVGGDTVYLIADEKVELHVKGTVNGRVLVYSPERIVIEGDLVYEQDPETVPGADDYLGLVSDKYVDIAPPDVTGPGDLTINAAIYAKRRFAVRRYGSRGNALLYLYGSLSVGTLSATEPRYATKIRFDPRLAEMRPPGFPMTDRYEVETWDANWRVEEVEEDSASGHVL